MSTYPDLPPIFSTESPVPGAQPPKLYFQTTDPTTTAGFKPDQAVMNTTTGDVFQLVAQAGAYGWLKVTNMRGPAGPGGDGSLDPAELEAVAAAVVAELDPPIDLVTLFENGLI